MKEGLKSKLLTMFIEKYPQWVHGGEAERLAFELNFMASNAGRRCRELEKNGRIEKRYNKNHEVEYRYKPIEANIAYEQSRIVGVNKIY